LTRTESANTSIKGKLGIFYSMLLLKQVAETRHTKKRMKLGLICLVVGLLFVGATQGGNYNPPSQSEASPCPNAAANLATATNLAVTSAALKTCLADVSGLISQLLEEEHAVKDAQFAFDACISAFSSCQKLPASGPVQVVVPSRKEVSEAIEARHHDTKKNKLEEAKEEKEENQHHKKGGSFNYCDAAASSLNRQMDQVTTRLTNCQNRVNELESDMEWNDVMLNSIWLEFLATCNTDGAAACVNWTPIQVASQQNEDNGDWYDNYGGSLPKVEQGGDDYNN